MKTISPAAAQVALASLPSTPVPSNPNYDINEVARHATVKIIQMFGGGLSLDQTFALRELVFGTLKDFEHSVRTS